MKRKLLFVGLSLCVVVIAALLTIAGTRNLSRKHLPSCPTWDGDFSWTKEVGIAWEGENGCDVSRKSVRWRTIKGDVILCSIRRRFRADDGKVYCRLAIRPDMVKENSNAVRDPVRVLLLGYMSAKDVRRALERFYQTEGNYYRVLDNNGRSILDYGEDKLDELLELVSKKYWRLEENSDDPAYAAAEVLIRLSDRRTELRSRILSALELKESEAAQEAVKRIKHNAE